MFKLKQGKRLIISLICLMLVALATFSCLGIIGLNKKDKIIVLTASTTDEEIAEADVLLIDSDEGFARLSDVDVNTGKVAKLMRDVSYTFQEDDGPIVEYLWGEFDGQGHTITFSGTYYHDTETGPGYDSGNLIDGYYWDSLAGRYDRSHKGFTGGAFCFKNYGTIKNTRFSGISSYTQSSAGESIGTHFGGVVGQNIGTIESCIVKDLSIKSNRYKSNLNVGAIAGFNVKFGAGQNQSGIIKNCLVEGYYNISGNDGNFITNQDGMYAYRFVAYKESEYNAQKCLFDTTVTPVGEYTAECKTPGGVSGDNFDTTSSDKTAARQSLISQAAWHVPPTDEYNDGWPYLEVFIDFETYNYTSAENGSVALSNSYTKVLIPTEVEVLTPTLDNFVIYGVTITATPNIGYKFKNWSVSADGKTFTANFELLPVNVTFNPICITRSGSKIYFKATQSYGDGNKNVNETYSPGTLLIGHSIQIMYSKSNNLLGFINPNEGWQATYWMNRTEGNPDINTWKKYTLIDLQINGKSINSLIGTSATLEKISSVTQISVGELAQNGITITAVFDLKSYSVTLQ